MVEGEKPIEPIFSEHVKERVRSALGAAGISRFSVGGVIIDRRGKPSLQVRVETTEDYLKASVNIDAIEGVPIRIRVTGHIEPQDE